MHRVLPAVPPIYFVTIAAAGVFLPGEAKNNLLMVSSAYELLRYLIQFTFIVFRTHG